MGNNKTNKDSILVLLQAIGDRLQPLSIDIINVARALGMQNNLNVKGALLVHTLTPAIQTQLTQSGLHEVYVFCNTTFSDFEVESHCRVLIECIERLKPSIVLVTSTPEGRALAPMIAANLKTGVTADCTHLAINEDGLLLQTRPAFGGNVMAEIITPTTRPQIATVRFNEIIPSVIDYKTTIFQTDILTSESIESHIKWIDKISLMDVAKPQCIIALGNGLLSKDDISIFEDIAKKTDGVLMCSRALVDKGWFSRKHQIGLSGLSVSPELLITFGISGSVQFFAGAHTAKRICAINTDAHAPIMQEADIPIVGNMYDIAAAMLSTMQSNF